LGETSLFASGVRAAAIEVNPSGEFFKPKKKKIL
jgi:hypothetical protein